MLRRLTLGFIVLACAAAAAACSSGDTTTPSSGGVTGIGPNFTTNTIYVSDTTANDILIYTPSPGPSATPQFAIAGSNTSLNNPRYLAFTSKKNLFVTNYNSGTGLGSVTVYQTYATGNVLPITTAPLVSGAAQPHGIAIFPGDAQYAIAITAAGQFFSSAVDVLSTVGNGLLFNIAGTNTGLDAPNGVAVDANSNLYVANTGSEHGAKSVTVYALPSPTPAPSPTTTPSPTPTPSVSPSPTPTPTPASDNLTPVTTITSASFVTPYGLTLDSKGNLYVTDVGAAGQAPKILVFAAPFAAGVQNLTPSATITSSALVYPSDVKVDSAGNIYVVDQGSGPSSGSNTSKLLIFAPNSNGAVAPTVSIALPQGSATGMALSP
jgi:sugar lactone lactonase YvrE